MPFSRLLIRRTSLISNIQRSMAGMSNKRLDGKVAVVTASTEGIGFAIARRLAQDGAKVIVSSRKEQNVLKALKELHSGGIPENQVTGMVCHVGKKEDRTRLLEKAASDFGGIDLLVSNCATNPVFGPALDCPEEAWDKIFDTNVKAAFLLSQEIHPYLVRRKGGSIIFISSIAGFQPIQLLGPYSVSKTALLGLTKVLSQQLGSDNIRVNCVAPGIIKTKFSQALTQSSEVTERMLEGVPLNRLGNPDDISGVVSFLASEDAVYITGENIVVAGGMTSRL